MKFSDTAFLGFVVLISGLGFGFAVYSEYSYDLSIRTNGRQGKAEFLRVFEKGSATIKGLPLKLPTCEYKVTDVKTNAVQIIQGECQSFERKMPFETYYLPQGEGHRLIRMKSLWARPIVIIPGVIFSSTLILFLFFLNSYLRYRNSNSATQPNFNSQN